MRRTSIDTDTSFSLLQGFCKIEGGFYSIVKALAGSNNTDTVIFKEICKARDKIEELRDSLKPSMLL